MKKTILTSILAFTCLFAVPVFADAPYTDDEVAAARHCVSEASGARTDDCAVIVWIDKYQATRRGTTVARFIATTYTRHTQSASRPWIGQLNGQLTRPDGWPEEQLPWETAGKQRWEATLRVARRMLNEDQHHGCRGGTPVTWGGTMDTEGVTRWLARGYRVLDCGNTRNRFVGR